MAVVVYRHSYTSSCASLRQVSHAVQNARCRPGRRYIQRATTAGCRWGGGAFGTAPVLGIPFDLTSRSHRCTSSYAQQQRSRNACPCVACLLSTLRQGGNQRRVPISTTTWTSRSLNQELKSCITNRTRHADDCRSAGGRGGSDTTETGQAATAVPPFEAAKATRRCGLSNRFCMVCRTPSFTAVSFFISGVEKPHDCCCPILISRPTHLRETSQKIQGSRENISPDSSCFESLERRHSHDSHCVYRLRSSVTKKNKRTAPKLTKTDNVYKCLIDIRRTRPEEQPQGKEGRGQRRGSQHPPTAKQQQGNNV